MIVIITAIVPCNRADAMAHRGWVSGRTNGFTVTLEKSFPTEGEARDATAKLPRSTVWSMQGEYVSP